MQTQLYVSHDDDDEDDGRRRRAVWHISFDIKLWWGKRYVF